MSPAASCVVSIRLIMAAPPDSVWAKHPQSALAAIFQEMEVWRPQRRKISEKQMLPSNSAITARCARFWTP